MKQCRICGEPKDLEDFYKAAGTRDGRRGECIACAKAARRRWYLKNRVVAIERAAKWQRDNVERHRAYVAEYRQRPERKRAMRDLYYRRTFGMTADDVDVLLEKQGGGCAICRARPERLGSLHVDHDHATGAIRGILCINCNHGLGKFNEDPELLARAAVYLGRR